MNLREEGWELPRDFVRDPLVSAIVPVYGAERFLPGLLADLEAQTIADRLEILIVDTASPTDEAAIVRELQRRTNNIAYLRTEVRESSCAAENRAIRAARAPFVTLAMADDRHRPDAFERLVETLERHPGDALAYADCAVTTKENATLETAPLLGHFRWPEFDPRLLFDTCFVGPQPLYRRSLHLRYGGFDERFAIVCDYEFWLRIAAAGERFRHVSEVLGLYLLSPNGTEHSNRGAVDEASERARRLHWPAAWGECPRPSRHFFVPVEPSPERAPEPTAETSRPAATPARAGAVTAPVSVIVPTRDRPDWLRRAVSSALGQTAPPAEVIVVNDGGEDVSAVLGELEGSGRILSIRLPWPRDRAAARNAGLALARGEYVAYLDDDDWWEPDHLETLLEALRSSGEAVAYSRARYVREERRGGEYVATGSAEAPEAPFDRDRLLVGNFIPVLTLVHRRSCLEEAGLFDERLGTHEDWDLWIRLSRRHAFVHVPRITANVSWREDGSSTTSARSADFVRTCELIHRRYAEDAAARPGVVERQRAYLSAMRARLRPEAAPAPADQAAEAREALTSGDHPRARQLLDSLLASAPQHADGWLMRGVLALREGEYDLATRAFRRAHSLGGDRRRTEKGLGMAELGSGRPEDAWCRFEALLGDEPDDAEALHWLLHAGSALQRWTALARLVGRYLELRPDDAAFRFALAGLHLREGRLDRARAEQARLERDAPDLDGLADLRRALAEAEARGEEPLRAP